MAMPPRAGSAPPSSSAPALALLALALLSAGAPACDRPDGDAARPAADTVATPAPDPAPADAGADADGAAVPFDAPVVVYLEAELGEIEKGGEGMAGEDFSVMADDLMFYRASAISMLERQPVRLVRLVGRRPLRFVVDGEPRTFAFPDRTSLDLVVLYAPGREPRALAPVDLSADPAVVTRYFEGPPAP
jgi:hypothetical protein